MKIFISHSSYDKWVARQISRQLEEQRHQTFLDEKDIKTGDSIDASIQSHLKDSDHLLIIISPSSLKSHWVFIEIGGGKALGKRIVPILFHVEPNEVPSAISQLLARDINDIDTYYQELSAAQSTPSQKGARSPRRKKIVLRPVTHEVVEFKVGDKVRLAQVEHLTDDDKTLTPKWMDEMDKYSGTQATITQINTPNNVRLSVDDGKYWWATRWFTKEA
jgi:hypothetical protein